MKNFKYWMHLLVIVTIPLLMTACTNKEPPSPGVKIGKPYQIYGKWYKPVFESDYDEEGIASWYGPGFHGNYTASGERFDKNTMTAAHTTLPMPSMVRVTNLSNNKSVIVRINDRGPFAENRIIDLSKKAAEELDMLKTGTAKVRVQYLHDETEKYLVQNNIKGRENILSSSATKSLNKSQLDSMDERMIAATAAPVTKVSSNDMPSETSHIESAEIHDVNFVDGSKATNAPSAVVSKKSKSNFPRVQEIVKDVEMIESRPALNDAFDYAEPPSPTSGSVAKNKAVSSSFQFDNSVQRGIFIQAGTFSNKENADTLAGKLSSVGKVNIAEINSAEKILYRVRVGPLRTVDKATTALQKIHDMGITDARMLKVSE
jgi:rare lipoprotein A